MKHYKYYLFGIIPILQREEYDDMIVWKLLKFFPIITIRTSKNSQTTIKDTEINSVQEDEYYDIA